MKQRWLVLAVLLGAGAGSRAQQAPAHTHLVIVVDGLRPDFVTAEVMPRLFRMGQRGIVFRDHHAAFPTVTRVNGSSFVTGTYPESHGLMGSLEPVRRRHREGGDNDEQR